VERELEANRKAIAMLEFQLSEAIGFGLLGKVRARKQ